MRLCGHEDQRGLPAERDPDFHPRHPQPSKPPRPHGHTFTSQTHQSHHTRDMELISLLWQLIIQTYQRSFTQFRSSRTS